MAGLFCEKLCHKCSLAGHCLVDSGAIEAEGRREATSFSSSSSSSPEVLAKWQRLEPPSGWSRPYADGEFVRRMYPCLCLCSEVQEGHCTSCGAEAPSTGQPHEARHWVLTGGSSDYYKVDILSPTTAEEPYTAECNDIIEALRMNFAEANAFKAIWRSCAARVGNGKPGTSALYDAEKVVFFGRRMIVMAEEDQE